MSISYNKLWKRLIDVGITKSELRKRAGVSTNIIAKLGKNESVTIDTLAKICAALNCDIGDVVSILADNPKS